MSDISIYTVTIDIHSFMQHIFLSTYYVPGTVLGIEANCLYKAYVLFFLIRKFFKI